MTRAELLFSKRCQYEGCREIFTTVTLERDYCDKHGGKEGSVPQITGEQAIAFQEPEEEAKQPLPSWTKELEVKPSPVQPPEPEKQTWRRARGRPRKKPVQEAAPRKQLNARKDELIAVWEKNGRNTNKTAKEVGLYTATLRNKLQQWGLMPYSTSRTRRQEEAPILEKPTPIPIPKKPRRGKHYDYLLALHSYYQANKETILSDLAKLGMCQTMKRWKVSRGTLIRMRYAGGHLLRVLDKLT